MTEPDRLGLTRGGATVGVPDIEDFRVPIDFLDQDGRDLGIVEKHQFAATRPLPTYLVALVTGPFVHQVEAIAPTPERAEPLPLGIALTQPLKDKTAYVQAETPRIVTLLEPVFWHREDLKSSMWGFGNEQYNTCVEKSRAPLLQKIATFHRQTAQ